MRVSSWLYLIMQTTCSACLLLVIGLCAGLRRFSPLRLSLTAAAMGLMTMAALSTPPWLRLLPLLLAAIAPRLAWPGAPRRLHLHMAALSLLLSVWMAGLLRALHPLALPAPLLLALGCAAMAAMPRIVRRTAHVPPVTTLQVRIGPRQLTLTALIDSGNLLRDAVTGLPVIVISRQAAARLMVLPAQGTLPRGMRLMNVRTISGTAMMVILRPDGLRLMTAGHWQDIRALIGLSPDGYEGFQALLPACLLSDSAASASQAISQGG